MAALRDLLETHGHTKVSTYIASGNVILTSDQSAAAIKREIEEALPKTFKLDSELIAVLVLTRAQLRSVVRDRPKGFGDQPDTYHSDAVFLMGIDSATAMKVFDPRPGVDEVWPGKGVIYSQRLSAERTKSRLQLALDRGGRSAGAHDHVAAGDVGRDLRVAMRLEELAQRRHRHLVPATDVDAAQEDEVSSHRWQEDATS